MAKREENIKLHELGLSQHHRQQELDTIYERQFTEEKAQPGDEEKEENLVTTIDIINDQEKAIKR